MHESYTEMTQSHLVETQYDKGMTQNVTKKFQNSPMSTECLTKK